MKPLLALALSLGLPALASAQNANPPHAAQADDRPAAHAIHAGQIWGADYFPNVELTTHEGQRVRFFDDLLKDKVVLINFIYTSCPDACPLETARIGEVYDLLKDRIGKDVHFYSISVDPEVDTPQVLAEYAQRFQVGPGWKFLTGSKADIRTVREKLGMIRADEQSLADHTLSLMIGNQATGRWMKRSPTENPYMLATQLGSWLHDWKISSEYLVDFKEAPLKLRNMSPGEELFRTRCGACHLVGADDGIPRSGPNLLGVHQRRDPAWLARWIAEPDVMLAEKDPLAVELFETWGRVPMPNLRLDAKAVEALVAYMQEESDRFVAEQQLAAADWAHGQPEDPKAEDSEGDERPSCCQKKSHLVLETPAGAPAEPVEPASGTRSVVLASGLLILGVFLGIRRVRAPRS